MFNEPWCQPIRAYKYVLKTDCDVFLTHHLKQYQPHLLLIGEGQYYDSTQDKYVLHLKELAKKFGWNYRYLTNVGCSMFGTTETVISIFQLVNSVAEEILKNEWFGPFEKGVVSMMATELAVNAVCSQQHVVLYALDYKSWKTTRMGSDVLHIHAWHVYEKWSKHCFLNRMYQDWVVQTYDQACDNAADYCQWIATQSIQDILRERKRIRQQVYANLEISVNGCLFKALTDVPEDVPE
jgi:hypothetical protein